MLHPFRAVLLATAACLLLPASALAETLVVDPADANRSCARGSDNTCDTIAKAIDAAQPGDRIHVLKGTYGESVTVPSALKDVHLAAEPEAKLTGSGTGDVLTIQATNVQVSGLSVEVPLNAGSAIRVDAGGAAVLTNVIAARSNTSAVSDPVIDVAGTATAAKLLVLQQAGAGGTPAIASSGAGGVQLADAVAVSATGPAVVLSASDRNVIVRSTLVSGQATDAGSYGVLLTSSNAGARKLTIDSSIVVGGARSAGIGVVTSGSAAAPATLDARHVTVAGAARGIVLDATAAQGPGLPAASSGDITATVSSSIVHPASSAAGYQAPLPLLSTSNSARLAFSHSDAPPATRSGTGTAEMGNASDTPDAQLFAKNFTLRADAPVIDKGGPLATGESTTDVQGDPRVVGAASDIGADEWSNRAPKADFGITNANPRQNEGVGFLSTSTDPEELDNAGGGLVEYHWDFGDGTRETTKVGGVAHSFKDVGTYKVTLVVKDKHGATSAPVTKTVTVKDGIAPVVTITTPAEGASFRLNPKAKKPKKGSKRKPKRPKPLPLTVAGKVADVSGVAKVEVALYVTKRDKPLAKHRGATTPMCEFYSGRLLARKECTNEIWLPVKITRDSWELRTRRGLRLPAGRYEVRVRATDATGLMSPAFSVKDRSLVRFRVR